MTEKPTTFTTIDKRNATETHVGAAGTEHIVRLDNEYPNGPKQVVVSSTKSPRDPAEVEAAVAFHGTDARTVATVHEVYEYGLPLWCFTNGKPNTALVRPLRRPAKSAGGIITSVDEKRGTLGTNALCYLVLNIGDEVGDIEDLMPIKSGDVVVLRNAMLEPLDDTLNTLSIHRSHVLAKVEVIW